MGQSETSGRVGERYEIHLHRTRTGEWTARCYDQDTTEHIWSSENASTSGLALREIERAIRERRS